VRIGDIVLRNRVVTSSSLLGYGVANSPLVPYGMSPVSLFVPLSEFGAVTTRTLTVEPREGPHHPRPVAARELRTCPPLRPCCAAPTPASSTPSAGATSASTPTCATTTPARDQWTIISLGGFSAEEFVTLIDRVNAAVPAGDIAAVELNVSCHNVNFDFSTILEDVLDEAVPRSNHPVLLKLSPDYDYLRNAAQAARAGVAGLTAINTVKALRLDPRTGQPLLANRFGGLSGRAVKPIGLRVVAELRDVGITLPIVATGGIRTVDDCREYFWAGADAVSLGSATWLASYPGYALAHCADRRCAAAADTQITIRDRSLHRAARSCTDAMIGARGTDPIRSASPRAVVPPEDLRLAPLRR
jgi:dihydroorotate dehydrogenase (NAD+) catalytic subunit